jgi:hypothetical protein
MECPVCQDDRGSEASRELVTKARRDYQDEVHRVNLGYKVYLAPWDLLATSAILTLFLEVDPQVQWVLGVHPAHKVRPVLPVVPLRPQPAAPVPTLAINDSAPTLQPLLVEVVVPSISRSPRHPSAGRARRPANITPTRLNAGIVVLSLPGRPPLRYHHRITRTDETGVARNVASAIRRLPCQRHSSTRTIVRSTMTRCIATWGRWR